ncbi:MAG: hypothetical protein AAF598_05820 [Bacteroidota bacterium]
MKHGFTLLAILVLTVGGIAQSTSEDSKTNLFPEQCLGIWEGTMYLYSFNTVTDSVPVRFTAARTETEGTYTWKTEYRSEKYPITKDYQLIVDDPETGKYLLDEGDGIVLIEYQVGNKLYSMFQLEKTYLTASTELIGDQLVFEVTSGKAENTTQGIQNYSFTNVQRVVYHRVNQ